jgi:hypothetical protein
MAKKLSFKDYLTVDYAPGEPEQTKLNAKKRKKDSGEATTESTVDEALTLQQRQKRSRQMRKYKSRMKIGRERAARKMADPKRLKKRARKQARNMLAKKLAKANYSELSFSRKQEIEKRLDRMKPRVDRIAKKLLPKMRKLEQERRRGNKSAKLDRTTTKND